MIESRPVVTLGGREVWGSQVNFGVTGLPFVLMASQVSVCVCVCI